MAAAIENLEKFWGLFTYSPDLKRERFQLLTVFKKHLHML